MNIISVKVFKDVINGVPQKTLFIKYKDRNGIERPMQLVINHDDAEDLNEFNDAQDVLDDIKDMIEDSQRGLWGYSQRILKGCSERN